MEWIGAFFTSAERLLRDITPLSITVRLLLAVLMGFLIGIDRSRKRRPAGVKTHVLVCMGAAMVMITSQYISQNLGFGGDIGRMGAQVISGIGFLGAGTILITGQNHVRGLTTAAGLWCSACLGLAAGIGFYSGTIIACVFVAVVLMILPRVSSYIYGKTRLLDFYLEVDAPDGISEVIGCIKSFDCKIMDLTVGKVKYSGHKGASVQATLLLDGQAQHGELMAVLGQVKGVRFIEEIGES